MAIVRGLITLADMRKSIYGEQYATAPTTNDAEFEAYISAATPWIENNPDCGVGPMFAESRTVTLDGGGWSLVLPHRFNTVTSIMVDGVAWTSYVADPTRGIIYGGTSGAPAPFTSGTQNVVVIVTVGFATIPQNVVLATRELCRLWWQQGRQANRPGPDESVLTPGILARVRALLGASPNVAGFA